MSDLLLDPVKNALDTVHARFAVGTGPARRYPADVAPFAVVADASHGSLAQLEELIVPGERVYLLGDPPPTTKGLGIGSPLHTFQMLGPAEIPNEDGDGEIDTVLLDSKHAPAMVDLTTLAFPGFFRPRTNEMGTYYGVQVNGELIAMAGERLCMTGLHEISGVCTHPAHTGKGYARKLMTRLLQRHASMGVKSFLHVGKANTHAARIYERMGFQTIRSMTLWPISRIP
jgi:ribosomal protein S18 acetylase RimI-like enzyme